MALVVRYFSTSAAGSGDGTTWANRAELFPSGSWPTIISANDFSVDSLECRIGPGTYVPTQRLQGSIYSVSAPTATSVGRLFLCGAGSDGVAIVPDGWNCAEGPLPTAGFPLFEPTGTATTLAFFTDVSMQCLCVVSNPNDAIILLVTGYFHFVKIRNTRNGAAGVQAVNGGDGYFANCDLECSGTGFAQIAIAAKLKNVRIVGNIAATIGNRNGVVSNSQHDSGPLCVINCPNSGILTTATNVNARMFLSDVTIDNCGTGVNASSVTALNGAMRLSNAYIANCANGLNHNAGHYYLSNVRLRNTTNIQTAAIHPVSSFDAAGSDSEYANKGAGDYRMKAGSAYHNEMIGAGDEPSTGGSSRPSNPFTQQVIG